MTGFEALTGHGVRADVDGITVWVGRRMLADDASLTLPAELGCAADGLEADGKTVVFCGWDGVVRGLLAVGDSIKDGAAEVVAELRRMGMEVEQRAANMRGAFTICSDTKLNGEKIILVDDVFTTGATTNACAKALQEAGAGDVCVWTVARGL